MDALFSKTIQIGKTTYYVDVKEAKNKSKYLTIAESKPSREGEKKFTRTSIMIFDNQLEQLRGPFEEAMNLLNKK